MPPAATRQQGCQDAHKTARVPRCTAGKPFDIQLMDWHKCSCWDRTGLLKPGGGVVGQTIHFGGEPAQFGVNVYLHNEGICPPL